MIANCENCAEYRRKKCGMGRALENCLCYECMKWDEVQTKCTAGKTPTECPYPARFWYSPTLWMFAMMDKPMLKYLLPRGAREEYKLRKKNGDIPTIVDLVTGVQDRLKDFKDGM